MKNQNKIGTEEIFNKQQNFFYNTIKKFLDEKIIANTLEKELAGIILHLSTNKNLNASEFELLGSLSYLVGIDYTNQAFIGKEISANVTARFKQFNLSMNVVALYVDCIDLIKDETSFQEAKDKMKSLIFDKIIFQSKSMEHKNVQLNVLRSDIVRFFNTIVIPVNMASGVEEIKAKKEYIYEDLLKISTLIQTQSKIPGNAIKRFIKIVNNPLYMELMERSMVYFDKQKFAVVYLDSILSVKESFTKLGDDSKTLLKSIIFGNEIAEEIYTKLKADFDAQVVPEVVAEVAPEDGDVAYVPHYTSEEVNKLMSNDQDEFIKEILCDMIKSDLEVEDQVIDGITRILIDDDYSQHLYSYLKSNMSNPHRSKENFNRSYPKINLATIVERINKIEEDFKSEYKTLVELACKPIPGDILHKVVGYVNATIEGVILSNDEQKQYLISQIMENGISTYNQLQQIVGMIETCDISGADSLSYVTLYKYLNNTPEILEVFEKSGEIEKFTNQIAIVKGFREWFEYYVTPVTPLVVEK